jgi:hypothetical protein
MKLCDILEQLDRSDKNRDENITWDMEIFISDLDLSCYNTVQDREDPKLKCYWISKHICTDTWVGYRAYYLNDVFVCFSKQSARGSGEHLQWADQTCKEATASYILRCYNAMNEDNTPTCEPLDLDQDLGDGYAINYAEELLSDTLLHNDKLWHVIRPLGRYTNNIVKLQHGDEQIEVDIKKTLLPWQTTSLFGTSVRRNWHCMTTLGNEAMTSIAHQAASNIHTMNIHDVLNRFLSDMMRFINSDEGQEDEMEVKEVQIPVIDFLSAIALQQGITEEEVIILQQRYLYGEIKV